MTCPFCGNQASTLTTSAMYCLPAQGLKATGSTGLNLQRPTPHQPSVETLLALRKKAQNACPKCGRKTPASTHYGQGAAAEGLGSRFISGKDSYPAERPLAYPFYHAQTRCNQAPPQCPKGRARRGCSGSGNRQNSGSGNSINCAIRHLEKASNLLRC